MFKVQKGIKDIFKIVHVTIIVISGLTLILWNYFLCTKKTKITPLFNHFFYSVSARTLLENGIEKSQNYMKSKFKDFSYHGQSIADI